MQSFAGVLTETVGNRGSCYRFGGEEFAVLLPAISRNEAIEIADRIRKKTAKTTMTHRGTVLAPVTVSIGIAATPKGGSVATLRTRADVPCWRQRKPAGTGRSMKAAGTSSRRQADRSVP